MSFLRERKQFYYFVPNAQQVAMTLNKSHVAD